MGPLSGTKVIEVGGIGPAPFCGMLFADMGAHVVLVERRATNAATSDLPQDEDGQYTIVRRGKQSLAMDLKKPGAAATFLRLIEDADVLIEGFRPGVMERLGVGPAECLEVNRRLVYGSILSGAGFSSQDIAQLRARDVI